MAVSVQPRDSNDEILSAHVSMRRSLWHPIVLRQWHSITDFHNYLPMRIGDRIKLARAKREISRPDLARATGIPYPTLAGIENSDQDSSTQLHNIARALRVPVDWLASGKGSMDGDVEPTPDNDWADILGVRQAAALGDGTEPDEYAETHKLKFRTASLARKRLKPEQLAVIYGKGDSMYPTIKDGDAILIDLSDKEPKDDCVFVITMGRDLMAKRLVKLGNQWFIDSDNKADPKWKKPVAIDEARGFEIHGRVRWVGSWVD
jgi:phage repressor protein C with HTH and peptisase S24 domain